MVDPVSVVVAAVGALLMLFATTALGTGAYFFRSLRSTMDSLRAEVQSLRVVVEGMKVTEQRLDHVEKTTDDQEERIRALERIK